MTVQLKIGVIYNGFQGKKVTPEEDELREMGLSVGKHLTALGYEVIFYDMDSPNDIERLSKKEVSVAFNVCERIKGNPLGEAYVPALLELIGLPHTSLRSGLIILAIHKHLVKSILITNNLPTPRYQVFSSPEDPIDSKLIYPLIVKGVKSENSIGITEGAVVYNEDELRKRISYLMKLLSQDALVEEFMDGREFNVAILDGKVLPISEIVYEGLPQHQRLCNYEAKWTEDSEMFKKSVPVCPAKLTDSERKLIEKTALDCYNLLGCDSYVRVDIRMKNNIPYILEVNQNPSIAETGCGFVRSCNAAGISYSDMIQKILSNRLTSDKNQEKN